MFDLLIGDAVMHEFRNWLMVSSCWTVRAGEWVWSVYSHGPTIAQIHLFKLWKKHLQFGPSVDLT